MKRYIGLVIIAITIGSATAEELPTSTITAGCFSSPDSAAIAGLDQAEKASIQKEFAGAIVEKDGSYCYTEPVSNGVDGSFKVRLLFPKDYHLVAIYHTHPEAPKSELFSKEDVDLAKGNRLVSYIRVVGSGKTLRFDPKIDRIEREADWIGSSGQLVADNH